MKITVVSEKNADGNIETEIDVDWYSDIKFLMENFGHELCMGIRHGLFGTHATEYDSIGASLGYVINGGDTISGETSMMHLCQALNRIAEAIEKSTTKPE